jgi:hypothetical protein
MNMHIAHLIRKCPRRQTKGEHYSALKSEAHVQVSDRRSTAIQVASTLPESIITIMPIVDNVPDRLTAEETPASTIWDFTAMQLWLVVNASK